MPSVLFVSYLIYGLVRPWVSRSMRQTIEIENESPECADEPPTGEISTSEVDATDTVMPKDAASQI
jgi:CDP-diacylglycerol--serine O-phosphatidyltransferase